MLLEVVYALSGFPGDVVVLHTPPTMTDSAVLHVASAVPMLEASERLCLERVLLAGSAAINIEFLVDAPCASLYLKGAYQAARRILDQFHRFLVELEKKVVANYVPGCTSLEISTRRWTKTLPAVATALRHALSHKLSGAALLRFFHKQVADQVEQEEVAEAMARLEAGCRLASRMQLRCWCLHGRVIDPHGEFFVAASAGRRVSAAGDNQAADERTEQDASRSDPSESLHGDQPPHQFRIVRSRLPHWFREADAEELLSTGVILDEMRRRGRAMGPPVRHAVERLLGATTSAELELAVRGLKAEAVRAMGSMTCVADVQTLLQRVRDQSLLGRGESWDAFLEETGGPLSDVRQASLAAERSGLEPISFHSYENGPIAPSYRPEWPLSDLLPREDEALHAAVFSLLLPVRAAHRNVNAIWFPLQRRGLRKIKSGGGNSSLQLRLQALRQSMGLLLEHLMFYFQVDVIEPYFRRMVQTLHRKEALEEFDVLVEAQRQFVTLTSAESEQLALLVVEREKLFEREQLGVDEELLPRARSLWADFERSAGLLFQVLSSVKGIQGSPSLSHLILRVDFNEHYSTLLQSRQRQPGRHPAAS